MVPLEVAEIFAPMQIMVVLVIALIVFGPKRLPDLGRSLGSALRELNKAKNDMMKSFTLDHDPEPEPYKYDQHTSDYNYNSTYQYNTPAQPDLTDYTIAGVPPVEPDASKVEGAVSRGSHTNGYNPADSADYTMAYHKPKATSETSGSAGSDMETGSSSATALAEAPKGEQHV